MLERIKQLAKKKGVSVRQVEIDCGLKSGAVYHWNTSVPSVEKVKKVADYFGVKIEDLL